MLALHARRSHVSIRAFNERYADRPLIVALTGTDLYRDIRSDRDAIDSLQRATRLIVLQERGANELAPELRGKVDIVYQSARPQVPVPALKNIFEISVIAHLREEKDPFRAALALDYLPPESRVGVRHYGKALDATLAPTARALMQRQRRYRWLGEKPRHLVARRLARSQALVISSRMEGGANVASEAIAQGIAVLASDIPGNVGMFGADYAGYFAAEDEQALARLIVKFETEPAFRALLKRQIRARQPLISREREHSSLLACIDKASKNQ